MKHWSRKDNAIHFELLVSIPTIISYIYFIIAKYREKKYYSRNYLNIYFMV